MCQITVIDLFCPKKTNIVRFIFVIDLVAGDSILSFKTNDFCCLVF